MVSEWFLNSIMSVQSGIQFQKLCLLLVPKLLSLSHRLMQKLVFEQTNWTHKMDALSAQTQAIQDRMAVEQCLNSFCCWFAFGNNGPLILKCMWNKCGSKRMLRGFTARCPHVMWSLVGWCHDDWTCVAKCWQWQKHRHSFPGQMWQSWMWSQAVSHLCRSWMHVPV
jgi:hypothetical protein